MTLDNALAPDTTSLASMNRLQLQAACVKLGLDSTPENELLRKQLREHDGYMQSHVVLSSASIATSTSTSSIISTTTSETQQDNTSQLPAEDTDIAMEDALEVEGSVVETIKVEQEGEQETAFKQLQEQSPMRETDAKPEAMAVEDLSIKQEVMEEDVQETLPFQETTLVQVKTEKEESEIVIKQEADTSSTITVKQEKTEESVTIKQEKVDTTSPSDDVKKEESPIPIAQRRQLWEARSAPSQQKSSLPLSKARINHQQVSARRVPSSAITAATTTGRDQKRRRTADGEDDTDVATEEQSSPTPQSGTVKRLIGKFAGSSISAPSSPVSKKRRVDALTSKSSPGPGSSSGGSSFPSIPKFKRVVKIPASSSRVSSSLYAMGNNATRSGAGSAGARRRAASDSANSSAGTTADRTSPSASTATATAPKKAGSSKPVSAETINRLATPKKINTSAASAAGAFSNVAPVPAPNFGASTSTAPSSHTVTKARGPVLSTAARAAQRAKK
ncbi:hypothetical protein EC991_009952 [Linnemannia zychae]|nr:hypothetical protein EC991_009952 [Linnemannia zychae]